MRTVYSLKPPKSEAEAADLYLYGDIEEGAYAWDDSTTPTSVREAIAGCPGNRMTVHINSYGGYTSAGIAIYNTLKECGKEITTIVEGFACSSASLIFMAGSRRVMRKSSLLMIHNAWTTTDGNADQLRKAADDLDIISAATAKIYEDNCSLSAEEIKALMDAETWIDAERAMEYGMATEITGDEEAAEPESKGAMTSYSSAFGAIREKLLAPEAVLEAAEYGIDPEMIAERVADAVKAALQEAADGSPEDDTGADEAPEQTVETEPGKTEAEDTEQPESEADPAESDEDDEETADTDARAASMDELVKMLEGIKTTIDGMLGSMAQQSYVMTPDGMKSLEALRKAEPEQTPFQKLFGGFR